MRTVNFHLALQMKSRKAASFRETPYKRGINQLTKPDALAKLSHMSLVAEVSEVKKEIVELEKFSAELRGYL